MSRMALASLAVSALLSACDARDDGPGDVRARGTSAVPGSTANADPATAGPAVGPGSAVPEHREVEQARLARVALASVGIPIYPGAEGLDSTEFEANTVPFIAIDFFSLDPPEQVVAYYNTAIEHLTARRRTTGDGAVVRYQFERGFSGLSVEPWDPRGKDSLAVVVRFDRRDAQGVTSAELEAYGTFLSQARTHVKVNVPRPEPQGDAS